MEIYYILFFPIAAGIVVAIVNSVSINERIVSFIAWTEKKKDSITSVNSKFSKYLTRPTCLALLKVSKWTSEIKNEGLKNGTRLVAFLYIGYIFAYTLFAIGFIILFLIAFVFFIWLILKFTLFKDDESTAYRRSVDNYYSDNLIRLKHYNRQGQKTGYSEESNSIFSGTKRVHFDDNYKKIGYTIKEKSIFGEDYEQHYNRAGKKLGKSQHESGLLGEEYVQHYDDQGNKIGYSKKEERILGSEYIVHYDQDGKKIGESEIE